MLRFTEFPPVPGTVFVGDELLQMSSDLKGEEQPLKERIGQRLGRIAGESLIANGPNLDNALLIAGEIVDQLHKVRPSVFHDNFNFGIYEYIGELFALSAQEVTT